MLPPEEPTRTWRSPRHWSLRTKFAVVLLVPGLLVLLLGGLRVGDQVSEAVELGRVAEYGEGQRAVADLRDALARERYSAAVFVADDRDAPGAWETDVTEVDARASAVGPLLDSLLADYDELAAPVRQAQQALTRLGDVRGLAQNSSAPASAVITRYSDVLRQLVELDAALLRGVTVLDVNGLAGALGGLGVATTEASLQYALVSALPLRDPAVAAELQSSEARLRAGLADFRTALDAGQRVRYAGLIAGPANTDRARVVQAALTEQDVPDDVAPVFDGALAAMAEAEAGVRAELTATSSDLRLAAAGLAVLNSVLIGLALLAAGIVVGLVARAMIRSLRRLRADALDVARYRLPEAVAQMKAVDGEVAPLTIQPVGIDTQEEIGEVARAFDIVHNEAVRLAAQQALLRNTVNDMFVNLSQRSQGLVKRQLALIDDLEKSEQDPEHLANLFQLDHLATRMRRNNENLLVLASAGERRARRKRPVLALDVLQAAVSEVEQYRRVTVQRAPGLAVAGPVVNDLVHLVAELLDNATAFSPPESTVVLRAVAGAGGTLAIEIIDSGIGMPPAELATINAQLADPPEVDVAVARRMGLFVVGRLATRHDLRVVLRRSPDGPGLRATVEVPAVHLVSDSTVDAPAGRPLNPPTHDLPVTRAAGPGVPETPGRAAPGGAARVGAARVGAARVGAAAGGADLGGADRGGTDRGGTAGAGVPGVRPVPVGRPHVAPAAPRPPLPAVAPHRVSRPEDPAPATEPRRDERTPVAAPDEQESPIYMEMRSAWFRQRRLAPSLGRDWPVIAPLPARPDAATAATAAAAPAPADRVGEAPGPGSRSAGTGPDPIAPVAAVARPRPAPAPPNGPPRAPSAAREDGGWGAAQDDGWAAARAAAESSPESVTTAGLPKRAPRSQLVPGSMSGADASTRTPARSPELVRGRLSGYQRGLRRGREARRANAAPRPTDGPAE